MRIKTLKEANALIDKLSKEVEYLTFENKQINGLLNEIEKSEQYKTTLIGCIKDTQYRLDFAVSLLKDRGLVEYNEVVYKRELMNDLTSDISEIKDIIDFNNIQEYMENKYPNFDEKLAEKISDLTNIHLEEQHNAESFFAANEDVEVSTDTLPIKRIYEINDIIGSIK